MNQVSGTDPHKSVHMFHERHMAGGQNCYFTVTDDYLQVRVEQRYWLDAHRKKTVRMLALQHTDCFVDLGCGEGYLMLSLSHQAGRSVGLDFVTTALHVLRSQPNYDHQRLNLVIASGDHIPLPAVSVDKLLCNHVIEHVLDDDVIMREIHRIVRPNGLVPAVLSYSQLHRLRLPRQCFEPCSNGCSGNMGSN